MVGGTVIAGYGLVASGVVGALTVNLVGSLLAVRRLDRFVPAPRPAADWPLVSVLIPARDEAATIVTCLRSLLAQDYPRLEIIVLDDQSSDATAALVADLARADARLRLARGGDLPPGWLGKCHACAQLATLAAGDALLFTDADTIHGPHSVANALAALEQRHVGLISALPRQRAASFAEALLLPLLPWNILALLPVGLVRRRPEPSLSAGVGQFLCFRRAAYRAAGGHAAVRGDVLDDVALARRVKAAGWRMDLLEGGTAVQCRMYTSFGAIWRGFSKNLFAFYGRSPAATVVAVALRLGLFVAPGALALAGLALGFPPRAEAALAGAYLLAVASRLILAARVGTVGTGLRWPVAWLAAALHPVAEAIHCAITLNSMRWGRAGRVAWKGRVYPA